MPSSAFVTGALRVNKKYLSSMPLFIISFGVFQMNRSKDRCLRFLEDIKSYNLEDSDIKVDALCVKENW